ncbi:hypothetical protein BD560DRAFT_452201 [Blakeslea trispora]|nr:hypothetical protein BD560DRAFT_452201 [Blakeslea trispora]
MFKRLLILESDKRTFWIKIAGALLITLRLADWPYELAFHTLQQELMQQHVQSGSNCLAQWGSGVIMLNFIADALANLFLSGMFVRRLYMHIRSSRTLMSHRSQVIEYIARKSLVCLIFTFVVNLTMNLLKITKFIGNRSDAFTVYFEIIESTLLVEALRVDHTQLPEQSFCEHCGMVMTSYGKEQRRSPTNKATKKQQVSDMDHAHIPTRISYHNSSAYTDIQLMSAAEQHESRNYTSRNM